MPIADKVAAANRINEFLKGVVSLGGLRLKYRITVDPVVEGSREWERPEILVQFSGPDGPLLLDRGAELLRSLELLAMELLRLPSNEHDKLSFDCMDHRARRLEELRLAAEVAACKVRETGVPYPFASMSSRERRILHLALRDAEDLQTGSEGEALQRHVVVYPKDYPVPPQRERGDRERGGRRPAS